MKICVLQPDYSTTSVDYQYYDPPRNLSPLLPGHDVHHVFLNKLTTYKQLRELSKQGYDCFVNLCEGYLEWEIPSVDAIYFLEMLNLPFTGPPSQLYHPTKELMKYAAYTEGVLTPAYAVVTKEDDVIRACATLAYPLFVKPAHAGDSLGIDGDSLARTGDELAKKAASLLAEYDEVLVEEYIDGREFTVLVAADAGNPKHCTAFMPVEYRFNGEGGFKTYALKTSELHPDRNVPVRDEALATRLKEAASKIFTAFSGVGYARLDFRMNAKGEIHFLEINFTCSVFYNDGYEGAADYILKFDPIGQAGFLQRIIAEGMARHRRSQKKFVMKGSAVAGYGIYAAMDLPQGEIIFSGEEGGHRLVTKRYVQTRWSEEEQKIFAHYAYPISSEVYAIWDKKPEGWAPQNHSCDPNTAYDGLNVVTVASVAKGEELTLDYAAFLDETAAPFECNCGAEACRKIVKGREGNSVTLREQIAGS